MNGLAILLKYKSILKIGEVKIIKKIVVTSS